MRAHTISSPLFAWGAEPTRASMIAFIVSIASLSAGAMAHGTELAPVGALPFRPPPGIEGALRSLARVSVNFPKRRQVGAGVVIDERTIITNCHVTGMTGEVELTPVADRDVYSGSVRVIDAHRDLCAVRASRPFRSARALPMQSPAGTQAALVGNTVYALGYPQGRWQISRGRIEGVWTMVSGKRVLTVDAPMSIGSSGGALLDESGRWLGVTTAIRGDGRQHAHLIVAIDPDDLRAARGAAMSAHPGSRATPFWSAAGESREPFLRALIEEGEPRSADVDR